MNNTAANFPHVADRDAKPENATQELALVRSSPFSQIRELATYLDDLDKIAGVLCKATILPADMQAPANLKLVLMQGLEMGFTPLQAIRASFIIKSKEGTKVGYYVQALLALIHRSPVCRFFRIDETTADKCRVICARADEPENVIHTFELTMQQARAANMDKKWERGPDGRAQATQKYPWMTAPADMLMWRTSGRAAKAVFPDVVFGMATPDELDDLDTAESLERLQVDFTPIPTTPQPRTGTITTPSGVRLTNTPPSANTHAERAAERRSEDIVDAEIIETPPYDEAASIAAAERAIATSDRSATLPDRRAAEESAVTHSTQHDEGTGDPAWDAVMATVATFSGVDTRGWIPPEFMKLWNERVDGVKTRDQLKPLMPWVQEMSKGAEKSKACADCAAAMKSAYNVAHAATREKSEAKP